MNSGVEHCLTLPHGSNSKVIVDSGDEDGMNSLALHDNEFEDEEKFVLTDREGLNILASLDNIDDISFWGSKFPCLDASVNAVLSRLLAATSDWFVGALTFFSQGFWLNGGKFAAS